MSLFTRAATAGAVLALAAAGCTAVVAPPPVTHAANICVWGDSVMVLASLEFPEVPMAPHEVDGTAVLGIGLDGDWPVRVPPVVERFTCEANVIYLGTNDLHATDPPQQDVAGYAGRFLDLLPAVPTVWITPPAHVGEAGLSDAYDVTIREVMADRGGTVVRADELGIEWNTAAGDPVHPTTAGALTLAQQVRRLAEEVTP